MLSITQENPEKGLFALWSLKIENILLQTTQIYMFFSNAHMMSVGGKVLPARFCWLSIGNIWMIKAQYDKQWLLTAFSIWKWVF